MKPQIDRRRINQPPARGGQRSELLFGMLVFLSGMAALTHQLLWTRRLIDLLGASGESSARVFGCFFLGLSIGSAIAATIVGRIQNPLRAAGLVQLGIALLVIPVVYLSELTDWIWPWVGTEATHGTSGDVIKSFLTLGFVLPPSVMMGLSFPLIVAGVLRRSGGGLARSGVSLYASNTLGGAAGVLLVIMVALPRLGNFGSMILATGIDAAVGIALLAASRGTLPAASRGAASQVDSVANSEEHWASRSRLTAMLGLAFFSGMVVLALEVAAFQMFQLVATISIFSPAAILFSAIASLGIAAAVFSRWESFIVSAAQHRNVVFILAASGLLAVLAPQIFMSIAQRSNWFAAGTGVTSFVFKLGALASLSIGPAWLVAGLLFPFAVASAGQNCSPTQSGQRLGMLLAVNGLGGLLGAELTYRVLLPAVGVYGSISLIGIGLAVVAGVLSIIPRGPSASPAARAAAALSASLVLLIGLTNSLLPVVNPPPGVTTMDVRSGREGTVAVIVDRENERSILQNNQYLLGGTSVRYDQERQVLLPLVLHRQPARVGCIGFATGITPGAALTLTSVDRVTAVEISPLVVDAAKKFFHEFNHDVGRSESASVIVGDGRTYIASASEQFDVVTGDLFLPWGPGTTRLYSAEHFAAVRGSLKPGGLFCQWLPMYQLTPEHFELIADTFASEFGTTELWMNHARVNAPMLALVGWKEPQELDWNHIQRRCDQLRESGELLDPVLRHASGIRLLHLGQWQPKPGGSPIVTLADPSLEYAAARVRLSADAGKQYFNPSNWVRFCRSRLPDPPPAGSADSSAASDLRMLATGMLEWDYARRTRSKLTDAIASRVSQAMPRPIAKDRAADWDRWTGPPFIGMPATSPPLIGVSNVHPSRPTR